LTDVFLGAIHCAPTIVVQINYGWIMFKFVVMFKKSDKPEEFENIYNDFLGLVERMPHISRRQVLHITGSPQGEPLYYRGLELYFASEDDMKAALVSPAGQEAGNELARFGVGTFDVFFSAVFEEEGGSTPL
jgi:uncharacterized protein (TIGR02118 family)